jgi:hypothetical protein
MNFFKTTEHPARITSVTRSPNDDAKGHAMLSTGREGVSIVNNQERLSIVTALVTHTIHGHTWIDLVLSADQHKPAHEASQHKTAHGRTKHTGCHDERDFASVVCSRMYNGAQTK